MSFIKKKDSTNSTNNKLSSKFSKNDSNEQKSRFVSNKSEDESEYLSGSNESFKYVSPE